MCRARSSGSRAAKVIDVEFYRQIMHILVPTPNQAIALKSINWHAVDVRDLNVLVDALRTPAVAMVVRTGQMRAIVAGRKFGASASHLREEFATLAAQYKDITGGYQREALLGAAFFHLRFANIHPLTDGNGRIGRLILAEQLNAAFAIPVSVLLGLLLAHRVEYRGVFAPGQPTDPLRRLLVLLAKLTGRVMPVSASGLAYPLEPTFPETDLRPPRSAFATNRGTTGPARATAKVRR